MLIVEYYFTAIPGPDTIGFTMSKFIRTPTNTATTGGEVLSNIESWKAAIQINYEVSKTLPSQQEIRAAFQRLIAPLKVASDLFKFHQDLIVSQIFGTQKISDDDVLKYFQQTEEKIHSMDTRKPLKFPDKAPASKANAINIGDSQAKAKGKGTQRSQSVPPANNNGQQKGSQPKKGDKGTGKSKDVKPQPKQGASPKQAPVAPANPPAAKPGGGNQATRTDNKLPGRIKKQCVPYTLPSGCVNGNNCPFQHANDPVTKKPLPPLQEDVERYQAALKRNPSLANPKPANSSGSGKNNAPNTPVIKMIRVLPQTDSEEEPEPEAETVPTRAPVQNQGRPLGIHSNPETVIDLQELSQRFTDETFEDPVCYHMRSRSMFSDIIFGGNQHSRWLYCRQCSASGAIQTLDMMSCVNCSLRHIHHPEVDTRKTCVWTKWLRMIARYRFRMTDFEKTQLKQQIQRRQDKRRFRRLALQQASEQPVRTTVQERDTSTTGPEVERLDEWEQAMRQERLSLLAHHATMTIPRGSEATSSSSTQLPPEERFIHVEHASSASPNIITTRQWDNRTLPRGMAFQVDRLTGRVRVISTGEFIPDTGYDSATGETEGDPTVSAINVGAVKGDHSEDHYCMLDSGANVMVIPWKEGMKGDHTMRALVGDHRTEGLVVARLSTRHRTHLIVAVKEAKPYQFPI